MSTVHDLSSSLAFPTLSGPIKLSVTIGDAQVGGSVVFIDGKKLKQSGAIVDLPLGNAAALVGKAVVVRTLVSDINPKSNHTSVTYVLEGDSTARMTLSREVPAHGDAVRYVTKLDFA
jgi:hypothetical protein